MTRRDIAISGISGLFGALILTAICLYVVIAGWISPPLSRPLYVRSLFLFLLFFSLAEIPVMIFALRRMWASTNPRARYVIWATNFGYSFFASVYAAPFILLAGHSRLALIAGVLMSALSLIRFLTALVFLPKSKTLQDSK